MREQLSSLISVAAISNAIDYFLPPLFFFFNFYDEEFLCNNQKHAEAHQQRVSPALWLLPVFFFSFFPPIKTSLLMASWQQSTIKLKFGWALSCRVGLICLLETEIERDCRLCETQREKKPCCWSAKQIRSWYLKSGVVIANHSTAVF